jgi:hypothetical protein
MTHDNRAPLVPVVNARLAVGHDNDTFSVETCTERVLEATRRPRRDTRQVPVMSAFDTADVLSRDWSARPDGAGKAPALPGFCERCHDGRRRCHARGSNPRHAAHGIDERTCRPPDLNHSYALCITLRRVSNPKLSREQPCCARLLWVASGAGAWCCAGCIGTARRPRAAPVSRAPASRRRVLTPRALGPHAAADSPRINCWLLRKAARLFVRNE